MSRELEQWASSLGRSVKVMGASYDLSVTKTRSTTQNPNVFTAATTTTIVDVARAQSSRGKDLAVNVLS